MSTNPSATLASTGGLGDSHLAVRRREGGGGSRGQRDMQVWQRWHDVEITYLSSHILATSATKGKMKPPWILATMQLPPSLQSSPQPPPPPQDSSAIRSPPSGQTHTHGVRCTPLSHSFIQRCLSFCVRFFPAYKHCPLPPLSLSLALRVSGPVCPS